MTSVPAHRFSAAALHQARRLAVGAGSTVDFRQAELCDAVDVFGRKGFDLVYTGIGALCWLPDVARWHAWHSRDT